MVKPTVPFVKGLALQPSFVKRVKAFYWLRPTVPFAKRLPAASKIAVCQKLSFYQMVPLPKTMMVLLSKTMMVLLPKTIHFPGITKFGTNDFSTPKLPPLSGGPSPVSF